VTDFFVETSRITVAVLAGGMGTRLRSVVADRPKVMAEIGGRPFITYLFDQLGAAGFRSVVLCTGYLGEQIEAFFGARYADLRLRYSRERQPLGTAGALRLALPLLESDPVLVLNGDSFCQAQLRDFVSSYSVRRARAGLVAARVDDARRYGTLTVRDDEMVLQFSEKGKQSGPAWINGGVYLLARELIASVRPATAVSLEYEVFPSLAGAGLFAFPSSGRFLDIGTPEDFALAEDFFKSSDSRAGRRRFVVLDRDGTIIEERNYLSEPADVKLLPGAGAALRELRRLGFGLLIITNQSAIGRGHFDEARLDQIHERLRELLSADDVEWDGLYYCPHTPEADCSCRKPRPGLLSQAAEKLCFDLTESIVIGDKESDVEMGRRVGATTFLVRTGYGAEFENRTAADHVVDDLTGAVNRIRAWCETKGS
jgi:D,D-heptose 1,7-bisphosphate phosphatase